MFQSVSKTLRFEQRGGIGYVRLTRPAERNALSDRLLQELQACFEPPEAKQRLNDFLEKRGREGQGVG